MKNFKNISAGTVILCKNKKETDELMSYLAASGYKPMENIVERTSEGNSMCITFDKCGNVFFESPEVFAEVFDFKERKPVLFQDILISDDEMYTKGLNDMFDAVLNALETDPRVITECETGKDFFDRYKKYVKNHIKPGDVVYCFADCDDSYRENKEHYGVVLETFKTTDTFTVLMKNGDVADFKRENLEKTGHTIELSCITDQI